MIERGDPSGAAAIVVCNFSADAGTIPIKVDVTDHTELRLKLYSWDARFGAAADLPPPSKIHSGHDLTIPESGAVIYLR